MDERIQSAALANQSVYDAGWTAKFVAGAPHLKHASVRGLFNRLLRETFERAAEESAEPQFLDIGAGEGSVTVRLLELGARVTAIDVSGSQLAELERKCHSFRGRLEVRQGDVQNVLHELGTTPERKFDAVVASACLHHFPDYLSVIRDAISQLKPRGQFLSFQDPLRYDSVGRFSRAFDEASYLSWRVLQGDLWGGLKRRLGRRRGLRDDCPLDNAEYHVLRGGVDQHAILALLQAQGFECELVRYFSTQSPLFQPIGAALGTFNTFAVVARRDR